MPLDKKELTKALEEMIESKKKRGFEQSVELIVKLRNIDLKKTENRINETIELPNGIGKPTKVCVMASGDLALKARNAKAEMVMSREDLDRVASDKKEAQRLANEYDYFIAEAPMMPTIGKVLGQALGPKGKMPTPIPPNAPVDQIIERHRRMVRVKARDNPLIQCKVGTESMPMDKIIENIEAVISRLEGKLERGSKNISKVIVKYSMSPPIKLAIK
ncbi:MAG: 50S ribosomal protein L1 [Candidatus Bathyarchaeota archaeon]|nr:50S ribosomal protein L1 [Candidatus Bathyarchaeota archaeon]